KGSYLYWYPFCIHSFIVVICAPNLRYFSLPMVIVLPNRRVIITEVLDMIENQLEFPTDSGKRKRVESARRVLSASPPMCTIWFCSYPFIQIHHPKHLE
ncbi:hypothetical protein L9F63_022175, partial [Diploptera punctata]